MNESLLVRIAEAQGRMEAKLDSVLEKSKDHDKRIGKLENHWAKLLSVFTLVGTAIPLALKYCFGKKSA